MLVHIVQQGECLSSLAARYGVGGWEELFEHPDNAELKKKRPNPNILAPGDEVVIPEVQTKFVPAVTGRRHVFQVKLRKVKLRIAVVNRSGKPYPGKPFVVNVSARQIHGTTASNGMVEAEVPARESTARLRVWLRGVSEDGLPTIDRDLAIGHIDPIDTNSGVQGRLSNLGYSCPITNGTDTQVDERLLSAARSFRTYHGLPAVERDTTGVEPSKGAEAGVAYAERLLDHAFRMKLLEVYESRAAS